VNDHFGFSLQHNGMAAVKKKKLVHKPDQVPHGRHKPNIDFAGVESRPPQREFGRENRVYSQQYNVLSFQALFEPHFV